MATPTNTPDLDDLFNLPADQVEHLACATHLGVWTARRLGLDMSPVHWEWAELAMTRQRLALVAPREHGKSIAISVNATVWRSIYQPGTWTYLFANTADQAEALLARVKDTLEQADPELLDAAATNKSGTLVLANGARVDCAGAGKRVRGAHPDVIVGDDVLDEDNSGTGLQRRKLSRWWFGTVVNMAHPGTTRHVRGPDGGLRAYRMSPTRIHLVGTPFHEADLLLGMRTNELWSFYRYAAECPPERLVPGTLAVEVGE